MEKTYRLGAGRKAINGLVRTLLRLGIASRTTYLLTVKGRSSGKPYSTPVTLVKLRLVLVLGLALAGGAAQAAGGYGNPVPGKRVYDTAGLLTPQELVDLERHALMVQQAGAAVVVFLQARDASYDTAARDVGGSF